MPAEQHLIIDISGQVQGVGFRYHTCRLARQLGLYGKVRNMPDGSVRVWIGGDSPNVQQMLEWLHHGPAHAHVEQLSIRNSPFPIYQQPFMIEA